MLRLYDTAQRAKVEFAPRREGRVSMYVCGPTPYDAPHLGHGRQAVVFDVIRRLLRFRGYDEVVATLLAAGFVVEDVRDAPDRPGREWVFVARAV